MAMTFDTDVTVNPSKVLKTNTINIPTSSGGSTYGPGTNGQVLKSNGTNVYWGNDSDSDTKVQQNAAITTNGAYPVILAYSTATSAVTDAVNKASTFTYNPNTKNLATGGTVDGYKIEPISNADIDQMIADAYS